MPKKTSKHVTRIHGSTRHKNNSQSILSKSTSRLKSSSVVIGRKAPILRHCVFMVRPGANHKPIVLTIPARRVVNICKQSIDITYSSVIIGMARAEHCLFCTNSCRAHIQLLVETPSLFSVQSGGKFEFVSTYPWKDCSFANKLKT